MKDWAWLTPVGYVSAAIVAGLFLWFNNRKSPYEDLKVLVDIHKDLPDMPEKEMLRIAIARQLTVLTAAPPKQPDRSPAERQKALQEALARFESGDPTDSDLDDAMPAFDALFDVDTIDSWRVSRNEESTRTSAFVWRALSFILIPPMVVVAGTGAIRAIMDFVANW